MNYQFDALAACEALRKRHASFLLDTFRTPPGHLWDRLWHNWTTTGDDPERMFAPLVVQGAWPFEPVSRPAELVASGAPTVERPLHPLTVQMLDKAGFVRPLYRHQVDAIRAAAVGQTVVLSAGTGSGKTEAFLIPLLDRLLWDDANGLDNLDQPGVRAVIVYPLNALVNNQVDRVLRLLRGQDRIRFAYYTSRLKDDFREGKRLLDLRDRPFHPCQIIDRKTLRGLDGGEGRPKGPPHILITNFSMLEYMLIRPTDRTIFRDEHLRYQGRPRLKAIVLDEAHVYMGAQAAEIHMLLRRTADRFQTTLGAVQGFATSATLGDGASGVLKNFAAAMFEKAPERVTEVHGTPWLPPIPDPGPMAPMAVVAPEIPQELRTVDLTEDGDPKALVRDPSMCERLRTALQDVGLAAANVLDEPARLLYETIRAVPRLVALRSWLYDEERQGALKTLDEVARWLFEVGVVGDAERVAADRLIRLCSLSRKSANEHPFLPVRMHAMLRTPAGVWIDPRPGERTTTEWRWGSVTSRIPGDDDHDQLEIKACARCGAGYLECWFTTTAGEWGDGTEVTNRAQPGLRRGWFPIEGDETGHPRIALPERWGGGSVRLLEPGDGRHPDRIPSCVQCGSRAVDLISLSLSPRAAVGSVVDAIYPYLGAHPGGSRARLPAGGRRLLTFSDSRQGAASLAAEVEYTHDRGVNRQILWSVIKNVGAMRGDEYVDALYGIDDLDERAPIVSEDARPDLARLSLFQEFGRPPAQGVTLETLGLVEVVYPDLPPVPTQLSGHLAENDWACLLAVILDDARRRGATRLPNLQNNSLAAMLPRHRLGKVLRWSSATSIGADDGDDDDDRDTTIALVPTARERSRVVRFARRMVHDTALHDPDEVALLRIAWDALLTLARRRTTRKWLELVGEDGVQVNLMRLEFRAHDEPPFIDPTTRQVAFRSLNGIPADPDSIGFLRALLPEDRDHWSGRHAVRRVVVEALLGLRSVEHTAQIDVDSLEVDEEGFRAGMKNLLSSSTTLEMGVDLGGLTFVLLTNAPPMPANYWQRAGRAGRRADGSSLVLTLAPSRPHDQRVFSDLRAFLSRPIRPPEVRLDGDPLLRRHAHAALLTAFFDDVVVLATAGNPMYAFGDVDGLLSSAEGRIRPKVAATLGVSREESLLDVFRRWCGGGSASEASLRRLLQGTSLATLSANDVVEETADALRAAARPALMDLDSIRAQMRDEQSKGDAVRDVTYLRALERQERSILREPLLGYLVRTGFLPRFGFPVDVVRLDTTWRDEDADGDDERDLRMERGLEIALTEYVPGAEVVANKCVYRVQGLIRNWLDREPELAVRRFYLHCRRCHALEVSDAARVACSTCGHPVQSAEEFRLQADASAKQRRRRASHELAVEGEPTPLRQMLEPSGFSVAWGVPPRRVLDRADPDRMPPAKVTLGAAGPDEIHEVVPGLISCGLSDDAVLLIRSEGRQDPTQRVGYGYSICQVCGFAVPEESWDRAPNGFAGHNHLRTGRRCAHGSRVWRHMTLGTAGRADVFRLRLCGVLAFPPGQEEALCMTLAVVLQQVAAELLQVDARSLEPMVATFGLGEGRYAREAIVLDKASSGVLARLRDDPWSVLKAIVTFLERADQAALVLFETQRLGARLCPDALRAHVRDPARRPVLLGSEDAGTRHLGWVERREPRMVAVEWLGGRGTILLVGDFIAEDAFARGGILRAVQARVLANNYPTRVLVARLPDGNNDEVVLRAGLRALLDAGAEVRVGDVPEHPWSMVRWNAGAVDCFGAEASEGRRVCGAAFGSEWLAEGVRIRAEGEAASLYAADYVAAWERAATVDALALVPRPTESLKWVVVPNGKTEAAWTDLAVLLAEKGGLGPLQNLGKVSRVTYRDRYFATNAISWVRLSQLLAVLTPLGNTPVEVTTADGRGKLATHTKAREILDRVDPPADLAPNEVRLMTDWLRNTARAAGWDVGIGFPRDVPHARRMAVEFVPGGAWRRIEILFDHGLEGVYPLPGRDAWTKRPWRTEEGHVFIRCLP